MPNHHPTEVIDLQAQEIASLQHHLQCANAELEQVRRDAATIVLALERSVQLIEALIAWLPEGLVLSEGVKTAKNAWTEAMQRVRG